MNYRTSRYLFCAAIATGLGLSTFGLAGCNLVESAQSKKVLAGEVLYTPQYDFSALNFMNDVGATVIARTDVKVFFGERQGTNEPKGISGAAVELAMGEKSFALKELGEGNYSLTSSDSKAFEYQPNTSYLLKVVYQNETFTAEAQGPALQQIDQFHTAQLFIRHTANQELELTRATTDEPALATVQRYENGKPVVTYSDLPSKPGKLLDLLVNDDAWRQRTIKIPASAFAVEGADYTITVATLKKGSTSSNLFTTSTFLVGTADIGIVTTRTGI